MRFISHRGNVDGPNPKKENCLDYLFDALNRGFEIEIDVWWEKGDWWLGHDEPKYKTGTTIFENAWCHAKNRDALNQLSKINGINYFWHDKDDYTITSKGHIWCKMGTPILQNSICVMPEKIVLGDFTKCGGICSDIIDYWKKVW